MAVQLTAVMILAIFYGCYFSKMLDQRRKGIQTDQMGKGKTGEARTIELTMKVTTLLVPLVELMSIYRNISGLPGWVRYLGIVLALLGDVVFVISVRTMKDSWRAGVSETEQTALVTDGIYQLSRNPAFLGFDMVYIGILLMFFHGILLVFSAAAMFMFHLQIVRVEEPFLDAAFGDDYREY